MLHWMFFLNMMTSQFIKEKKTIFKKFLCGAVSSVADPDGFCQYPYPDPFFKPNLGINKVFGNFFRGIYFMK
jgi:hypothetical protein